MKATIGQDTKKKGWMGWRDWEDKEGEEDNVLKKKMSRLTNKCVFLRILGN